MNINGSLATKLINRLPGIRTFGRGSAVRTALAQFEHEFITFKRLSDSASDKRFELRWEDRYPCLKEKKGALGFDRHYVYHTAWAARIVAQSRLSEHVDIGSSLYFCGMLSAFIRVRFYEYHPVDLRLSNLSLGQADLLQLPFTDATIESISCMHVVEHVGLGRYGDPLDPQGDQKAMRELARVLAPGGTLLFVVPVGRPRICFNAHRIYSFHQVREGFCGLDLREFALVPDDPAHGALIMNPGEAVVDAQNYGCGCFWFVRHA